MATAKIALTPSESLVCKCLLACRDAMKNSVPGMQNLELRFAGGWVRDKIMGGQSHDIDVALSTMTGLQFGEALKTFMDQHEHEYLEEARALGIPAIIKGLHKIEKNPELSKHLETVTTKMFGLDMDFVNLRKEVYDDVSRNPTMEFGTPEEDALRRDATVNSLFYHLDKQLVEDFTERGLDDMQKKILRTPLEPYQTFKDDPLRVLRLIRFSSRLDYEIEHSAYEAMKDTRIHQALRMKISRERVGVEVTKIMAGPDPLRGLMDIYRCGLFEVVFANPSHNSWPDSHQIPKIYEGMQNVWEDRSKIWLGLGVKDDQALSWFLATYVPWARASSDALPAAREAIRAPNALTKVLESAIKNRALLRHTVDDTNNGQATRSSVGVALRNSGSTWRSQILYSLLFDLCEESFASVTARYKVFLRYLDDHRLTDADKLRPIIDGNEIKKAMGLGKAGPWLKRAIEVVVEWQFQHPLGTAPEAREMVRRRRDELQTA